jgi:hypothetical protein
MQSPLSEVCKGLSGRKSIRILMTEMGMHLPELRQYVLGLIGNGYASHFGKVGRIEARVARISFKRAESWLPKMFLSRNIVIVLAED